MEVRKSLQATVKNCPWEFSGGITFVLLAAAGLIEPALIPFPRELSAALFGFGLALTYDAFSKADLRADLTSLRLEVANAGAGVEQLIDSDESHRAVKKYAAFDLGESLTEELLRISRTPRKRHHTASRNDQWLLDAADVLGVRAIVERAIDGTEAVVIHSGKASLGEKRLAPDGQFLLDERLVWDGVKEIPDQLVTLHGAYIEPAFVSGIALAFLADRASLDRDVKPALKSDKQWLPSVVPAMRKLGVDPRLIDFTFQVYSMDASSSARAWSLFERVLRGAIRGYCLLESGRIEDAKTVTKYRETVELASTPDGIVTGLEARLEALLRSWS